MGSWKLSGVYICRYVLGVYSCNTRLWPGLHPRQTVELVRLNQSARHCWLDGEKNTLLIEIFSIILYVELHCLSMFFLVYLVYGSNPQITT